MNNKEVKEAIELLAEYCGSITCRDCQLHLDKAGCLFGCGYPYQWVETMKEIENDN